jgi:hypothetical protein
MSRRTALALTIAALIFLSGVFVATKRMAAQDATVDRKFAATTYPFIVPDLCRAIAELRNGKRNDAYNSFYRRAHPGLHALSADVDTRGAVGKTLSGTLRKAKSKVEAGLIRNPPELLDDFRQLVDVSAEALTLVKADSPTSCRAR